MPKALTDWSTGGNARKIDIGSALCPLFYVSTTQPSIEALTLVSDAEIAVGWPAAIVNLATERRKNKKTLWAGPAGVSLQNVGRLAPSEIMSPGFGEVRHLLGRIKCLTIPTRDSALEGTDPGWRTSMNTHLDGIANTPERFIEEMTGRTGLQVVSKVVAGFSSFDTNATALMSSLPAGVDEVVFVFDLPGYVYSGNPGRWGNRVTCVVKAPGLLPGVRGVLIRPVMTTSIWPDFTRHEKCGYSIAAMAVADGFVQLMDEYVPEYNLAAGAAGTSARDFSRHSPNKPLNSIVVTGYATGTTDPWGVTATAFEHAHSVWRKDVYHIGDPEFCDGFTVLGTYDANLKFSSRDLYFEWAGSKLAAMKPEISPADAAALSKLYVTSRVADQAIPFEVKLANLDLEKMLTENGKTCKDEVILKSRVEDGETLPDITFADAEKRAVDLDRRIYHKVLTGFGSASDVDYITLSGPNNAGVAKAWSNGVDMQWDINRIMMALSTGEYPVIDTYGGIDPYSDIFGYSITHILQGSAASDVRFDFDEAVVFGEKLPIVERLGDNERTAMMLMWSALARKQFSSFTIGAAQMASLARKKLI